MDSITSKLKTLEGDLAVFVYIPFCLQRCKFCFYNVITQYNESLGRKYVKKILHELKLYDKLGAFNKTNITCIYIGGGTPTALSKDDLTLLLNKLSSYRGFDTAEITVEVEPNTITEETFPRLYDCGVNRLSIGIQDFDENVLMNVGRPQSTDDIIQKIELAKKTGFENINVDLMYGLPKQQEEKFLKTIDTVIKTAPKHITLYNFVMKHTIINTMVKLKKCEPKTEPEKKQLWEISDRHLRKKNYQRVGTSHYAIEPKYRCNYENHVWDSKNLIGLGIEAYSFVQGTYYKNIKSLKGYLETEQLPIEHIINLSKDDKMRRHIFYNITERGKLDFEQFHTIFGQAVPDNIMEVLVLMKKRKIAKMSNSLFELTEHGMNERKSVQFLVSSFQNYQFQNLVTDDFLQPESQLTL